MKYLKKFLDLDKMMMIALDNSKTKCENLNCIFMNEEELIVIKQKLIEIYDERGIDEANGMG